MSRVQVILGEEEQERLRRRAEEEGMSLSSWMRRAALERLAAGEAGRRITTVEELQAFFAALDTADPGEEPDWEEHRRVIEGSIAEGRPGT